MKYLVALTILLATLPTLAWASPYDGWTLEQIKAEPRFQQIQEIGCGYRLGYTSGEETSTPEPNSARDTWIGFIRLDKDKVVLFNRSGAGRMIRDWGEASIHGPDTPLWMDEGKLRALMISNHAAWQILYDMCDTCEEKCG